MTRLTLPFEKGGGCSAGWGKWKLKVCLLLSNNFGNKLWFLFLFFLIFFWGPLLGVVLRPHSLTVQEPLLEELEGPFQIKGIGPELH